MNFVGLDAHYRQSSYYMMNGQGQVVKQSTVRGIRYGSLEEALKERVRGLAGARRALRSLTITRFAGGMCPLQPMSGSGFHLPFKQPFYSRSQVAVNEYPPRKTTTDARQRNCPDSQRIKQGRPPRGRPRHTRRQTVTRLSRAPAFPRAVGTNSVSDRRWCGRRSPGAC